MNTQDNHKNIANQSPPWSSTTKLLVGLSFVAILAGLLIGFRSFVIPLLLSFVIAYLLYPIADRLRSALKITWRVLVTFLYLFGILILLGLLTWGGLTLVDQVTSLVGFLQRTITDLPDIIDQVTKFNFQFGPLELSLDQLDLSALGEEILGAIQPMLASVGTVVTSLASGTFVMIGWGLFILVISYFILVETEGIPGMIFNIDLPGYRSDLARMGKELGRIWNAFLRGQLIVMGITVLIYSVLLSILGVRFSIGLALLAAITRLIPYVGPAAAWTTYGLVAYFQGSNIFHLQPLVYVVVVVGISWLTDAIIDNFISPRILGNALRVHPAAVMVAALVAVSLFGVVGVILAAPVLATLMLFGNYALRKSFDQDPWESIKSTGPPPPPPKVLVKAGNILSYSGRQIKKLVIKIFEKRKMR